MKAVVVSQPGRVEVRDVPEPVVGRGDVLVRVMACGICGTDLHIVDGEFPPTRYPIIPGHEFSGEVIEIGADVVGIAPGDRVGVDPTLNCGSCRYCQRGMGNLCARWNAVGVGHHPGGFAELVAVPERCAHRLPDGMSFADAALVEPVACVVRGLQRLHAGPGESFLIYGAGPMGMLNAQLARHSGARSVAIVDLNQSRLDRAKEAFGFADIGQSVAELRSSGPDGFENVIEATGRTAVAGLAVESVSPGGKLLIFGVCPPGETAAYDMFRIYNREITVLGTMALVFEYGPAVDIVASGAVNGPRIVTHRFPLDDFGEAVALARVGSGLKIHVLPNRQAGS